ncbi:hypothetical protein KP509_17G082600 [Ceratopteris richardii]|uniref:Uncharacterized protein n=1 Tax=Ceratopteris richardii TaxID=49495 RepID=A0A8T2SVY8_CERRI|nr:hypothetical protein KP509_17G082600 [Ceratopteris richardii]
MEFGTGWSLKWCLKEMRTLMAHRRDNARRYCMVEKNKRRANIPPESWQFFRRQLRLQESFPQQKTAAKKRVESGHTLHLGQMGHNGFVATFRKDYGRYPTKHEIEYATHFGYRHLSEYIQGHFDAFEYYGETNMDEVERQTQEGRSRSSQGDHDDEDEEDQDDHDIADDDDDHDDDD